MPEMLRFPVDVFDVAELGDSEPLHRYGLLIFLASTWGDGELQVDMENFFTRQSVALAGKRYAICELGNYYGYDDFEFGALRIMQYHLERSGGQELVDPFCMDSLPRKDWGGFKKWCDALNRCVAVDDA